MILKNLPFNLILGSQSPRRRELLEALGFEFSCLSADIDENYDADLTGWEIAEYLAKAKAEALRPAIGPGDLLLTADTVVWCRGRSLEKPQNQDDAREMLRFLSNSYHEVITGVGIYTLHKQEVFSDVVQVKFAPLSDKVINHYLHNYRPYDKAGAYGIQEWIGMWAIERIEGNYFTVMGLPTHLVGTRLMQWCQELQQG